MLIRGRKIQFFSIPTEGAVTQQHQHKRELAAAWQRVNGSDENFKELNRGWIITMRTSSHRLAAVRKREAILLASVNCSNLCLNLGSYLQVERIISLYYRLCYTHNNCPPAHKRLTTRLALFQHEPIKKKPDNGKEAGWCRTYSLNGRHNINPMTAGEIHYTTHKWSKP